MPKTCLDHDRVWSEQLSAMFLRAKLQFRGETRNHTNAQAQKERKPFLKETKSCLAKTIDPRGKGDGKLRNFISRQTVPSRGESVRCKRS